MNTNDMTVWANQLVPLTASQGDPTSVSVTIHLIDPEGGPDITQTAIYGTIDGEVVADLTFTAPDVSTDTVYDYYVTENFGSEDPLVYPDPSNCDGECELPKITVCILGGETS